MRPVLKLFVTLAPRPVSTLRREAATRRFPEYNRCGTATPPLLVPTALFLLSSERAGVRLPNCQNRLHETNKHTPYFWRDAAFERNHAKVGRFVVYLYARLGHVAYSRP